VQVSWIAALLRATPRALRYAFVETALVIAIAALNPFEVDEAAHQHSWQLWKAVQADLYGFHAGKVRPLAKPAGSRDDPNASLGRDAITVVYLDETSLKTTAGVQQPSLREHAVILDDLARAHKGAASPRAIFIDIIFANVAPKLESKAAALPAPGKEAGEAEACATAAATTGGDAFRCYVAAVAKITHYAQWRDDVGCQRNPLAKLACIQRSGGVPIIFATAHELSRTPADDEHTPAEEALGDVAILSPAFVADTEYDLMASGGPHSTVGERFNGQFSLPPASLLYAAYCWTQSPDAQRRRCPVLPAQATSSPPYVDRAVSEVEGTTPLEWAARHPAPAAAQAGADGDVAWQTFLTQLEWAGDDKALGQFARPVEVRWGVGFPDAFTDMMVRLHGGALSSRCRPAERSGWALFGRLLSVALPTFANEPEKADCLYTHSLPIADFDGANITEADRNLALDGKIVLLGGQFAGSGDWLPAAHGAVPGVYYHAMALDNLIQNNVAYPKVPRPFIAGSAITAEALLTFLAIFVLGVATALALMGLNEPALNPARAPDTSPPWLVARPGPWLVGTRGRRWVARILVAMLPATLGMAFLAAFAERGEQSLYNLNVVAILILLTEGLIRLLIGALHPFLERREDFFRLFEVGRVNFSGIDPHQSDVAVQPADEE
jgi:hypothetical protein